MELKVRHIVLTAVFCLFSLLIYAQMTNHPPAPMMSDDPNAPICDQTDDDGDPSTPYIPPPVGLPCRTLPIDDYIFPLLVAGLALGAYQMRKLDTARVQKL